MARNRKGTAAERWRERLNRFETSGLTVREFCSRERVSEPSFYHWRRRLGEAGGNGSAAAQPAFQAVRVTAVAGVLSVELPGGTRIEVPADCLELAHVVVREVAAASRSGGA